MHASLEFTSNESSAQIFVDDCANWKTGKIGRQGQVSFPAEGGTKSTHIDRGRFKYIWPYSPIDSGDSSMYGLTLQLIVEIQVRLVLVQSPAPSSSYAETF